MDRRALLSTAAVAAVPGIGGVLAATATAATATAVTATSSTAQENAPATIDLGPATLACTTLTGGFVGERAYIVSHLLQPARLGVFDIGSSGGVTLTELPTGGGAWASVVDGDHIYIGTHTVADLYRANAATGTLDRLGSIPGATYVWDMCRAPDGMIYLGTYPDGKVWELDPASGGLRDLGVAVPGQTYVRSIVADATHVYAGVGSHAHLVVFDRAGGPPRDITPPELATESFVYQLTQTSTQIVAGTHGTGLIAIIDKADPTSYRVVHPEGVVTIGKLAATGNDVYFGAGDVLWHLDLATGVTRKLGTTAAGDFITAVHLRDGAVVAFTNSATMWTYDVASSDLVMFDFQAAGMPEAAELPQSIRGYGGRQVYVGGHGGVEVHNTLARPGTTERIRIHGEAKAITSVGRHVYLAMYTSGSILRHDTVTGSTRAIAVIGNEQNRPGDLTYDPHHKVLLVASSPDYGKVGGALTVLPLATGKPSVYRNLVEGHAIVSTAIRRDTVYVGTDRQAASTTSATVAHFDVLTRRKIGETVPVPGAPAIPHLVVLDEMLYGTTSQGRLFAIDTRTGAVTGTAGIASGRADLVVAGSRLFAASHQRLLEIDPRTLAIEVIVDGLNTDPTSFPMVSYDDGYLFTIAGRNLLQVRLPS